MAYCVIKMDVHDEDGALGFGQGSPDEVYGPFPTYKDASAFADDQEKMGEYCVNYTVRTFKEIPS